MTRKVKEPNTFEQKYKTVDGKIITDTPHTAWVRTKGKQPRLLRNSVFAFVTNSSFCGSCRPSRFSDYKSAWRTGPCLRFLDIENPNAPRHHVFKEDTSGLPVKITRKEIQSNPTKKLQEKEQGKAGTTDANKGVEVPVGKMKIGKNHINFIKRFGIINVVEYITITEKSKQQEHAGKRHTTATTTNEKIGSS